jgi:hypothetical protein
MSGRDDDLYDVDDLRRALGRVRGGASRRPVAAGVAVAIVAIAVALALVPHALGAVGTDAVDTGGGPNPDPESADGARQRYQNYLTNLAFLFAPTLLTVAAVGVAFAGALRARGSRRARVGTVVAGSVVGMAVGYVAFVAVGHLAYGEAAEGYIVEQFPVALQFGAIAANAVALAAVAAVGSALAAVAGTVVEPDPGRERAARAPGEDAVDGETGPDASTVDGSAVDESAVGAAEADAASSAGADATEEGPARVDDPASDYREVGARQDSSAPAYDPEDRDWDGSSEDST